MQYVLPALVDGLTACVMARPADPVDFMAEYLLQHSRPLYLDHKVPFTRMTAQIVRKRKKLADAVAFERKMGEEEMAAHLSQTAAAAVPEMPVA